MATSFVLFRPETLDSSLTPLSFLHPIHKKFCWFYHQNRSRIYLSLPPQLTLVQTIIISCPDYCPNWPLCLHPCPPPHQSFLKEAHSFLLPPCYCFHKTILLVGLAWKSDYLPGRFSQECIATIICLGSRWVGPSKSVWHSDVKVFFEIFRSRFGDLFHSYSLSNFHLEKLTVINAPLCARPCTRHFSKYSLISSLYQP